MLMNLKAGTEAMRAMIGRLFYLIDVAEHEHDAAVRTQAQQQVELLTPLVKAYCSDFGYDLTREAVQVLGGVGYCSEFPAEQYARDIKIVSIWEGTNFIQALDLVGRKLGIGGGKVFQDWLKEVTDFTGTLKDDETFAADGKLLFKASQAVGDYALRFMKYFGDGRMRLIPLSACHFLASFAETLMAKLILEQGIIAREKLKDVAPDSADGIFYRGKVESAKFFCRNILPNVFGRHMVLQQEDTSALDIPEEAF